MLETGGWIYHGKFRKYVNLIRISSDQQCFLSSKVIFIFIPLGKGEEKNICKCIIIKSINNIANDLTM